MLRNAQCVVELITEQISTDPPVYSAVSRGQTFTAGVGIRVPDEEDGSAPAAKLSMRK
jgi:hypothetical protein